MIVPGRKGWQLTGEIQGPPSPRDFCDFFFFFLNHLSVNSPNKILKRRKGGGAEECEPGGLGGRSPGAVGWGHPRRGSAARGPGGGLFTSGQAQPQDWLGGRGRPGPAPNPPVPAWGPRPLPLGDRRPSKKHAGTRPLKEPPHGKSSGRRTWFRDRVPFLRLLLLPGAGGAVLLLAQGTASRGRAQRTSGGTRGPEAARLGPLGQRHRREVGSASYSPCKFKKSPAKC